MTTDYDSVDYFTDPSLVPDPHPYYDHIRDKDPVCCPIDNGVLAVTGWESANNVYKDTDSYSAFTEADGNTLTAEGTQMYSLEGFARWNPTQGQKGGWGGYYFDRDYDNTPPYYYTRRSIGIVNPPVQ